MITRRFVLKGALGLLVPAPMVVRAASLMPLLPEAFVERMAGVEMPLCSGDSIQFRAIFDGGEWYDPRAEINYRGRGRFADRLPKMETRTFHMTRNCAVAGARLGSRGSMELILTEVT